jgi:hypothetical protein
MLHLLWVPLTFILGVLAGAFIMTLVANSAGLRLW